MVENDSIAQKMQFMVGDGKLLQECVGDNKFDIVIDKGCLDCFVSGSGEQDIIQYLQQLSQVLKPDGVLFLVPVNGADILHLLKTGKILSDKRASGRINQITASKWEKSKETNQKNYDSSSYQQQLFVHEIVGRDEKHLFICRKENNNKGEVNKIVCDMCGEIYGYPDDFPTECGKCLNRIQRFALS
eukprot:TRINITY_DN7676_c0_g1_i1.p2 TRINITY_DN7676_c0_g1~~TRINITY_DN7676_c0_g1_i1.p2  ORF type:complete len:187 (-),score=24.25 TRINITY_DN7676_c0_g1_i1:93-653(-)